MTAGRANVRRAERAEATNPAPVDCPGCAALTRKIARLEGVLAAIRGHARRARDTSLDIIDITTSELDGHPTTGTRTLTPPDQADNHP